VTNLVAVKSTDRIFRACARRNSGIEDAWEWVFETLSKDRSRSISYE